MIERLLYIGCALFWGAVSYRLYRYPAPHIGINVLLFTPLFAIVAAVGVWKRDWPLVVIGAASVLLLAAFYQFNVLVPYEVWLKRGMPPRPF
jgi:hypothetical protein